jgi:predicted transcriptional regulator
MDGTTFVDIEVDHGSLVSELRVRTGLSYGQLAALIGVERRTLYFWLEGRSISPDNRSRLESLVERARLVDHGSPAETAQRLVDTAPTPSVTQARDRLEGFRIRERDEAARFPFFDVATLLGGVNVDEEGSVDTAGGE